MLEYRTTHSETGESLPDALLLIATLDTARSVARETGTYVGNGVFTYTLPGSRAKSGRGFFLTWSYETRAEYVVVSLRVRPDRKYVTVSRRCRWVPVPTGNRGWEKKAREILEGVRRLAPDAEILEPGDAAAVGGVR